MKKTLLLAAASCMLTTAHAAWQTSDTDNTVIGKAGEYGQAVLRTVTTPNGSTVVTWLNTPSELGWDDADFGFYLYMQIYDAQGNALFPQGGKQIVAQHTDSWVSGYGLSCMDNGDILIAYNDKRNTADGRSLVYAYRYNEQGEPVWSADGVMLPALTLHDNPDVLNNAAQIVASGENIYVAFGHEEYWMEEANEDNWSPSPWFPDEEMPDSVSVSKSEYQLYALNAADGAPLWDAPKVVESSSLFLYPAPEGCLYSLYTDADVALYADKFDANGVNLWGESVPVCEQPLSSYGFLTNLPAELDEQGNLAMALSVPNGWVHYTAINYLQADGSTFFEPVCGTEDPNTGNSDNAVIATKGDDILAAWPWEYSSAEQYLWVNKFDKSGMGDYAWQGDNKYGIGLDMNSDWGMKAVKAVAQEDGWVVLYGNCTSWSGANFMVVKINDAGEEQWRKQIAEPDFKCSNLQVEADAQKAVIFYTCDQEYDENWDLIPGDGGLRMMCVALTDGDPTAIRSIETAGTSEAQYFDLQGRRYAQPQADMLLIKK